MARFDTAEITLRAAVPYDGTTGTPNPFRDVSLVADVTAPDGRTFTVDGFFDGDGAGGPSGNVFRFRVYADAAGTWTWRTRSDVPGLDRASGAFAVAGTLAGAFGSGAVVVDPARPRYLRFSHGPPVYLLGKYLDRAAPAPIRYSQLMFSEARTDADRRALLDRHLGMGLNKINVYVANVDDYGGSAPTTPWRGSAATADRSRFDLARWRMYEAWVREMRRVGVVAQLWLFADGLGDLPQADRELLIRQTMARLSPYANTVFTLVTEWQEGWTTAEVDTTMRFLAAHNPWRRLASVHGVPGDFSFPDEPWADYLDLQAGLSAAVTPETIHALGLRNRALAAKPLFQEEFCVGHETDAERRMLWAAFTSGAAASGTGAFLLPFSRFVSTVPFSRMAPADGLVQGGSAWVLAGADSTGSAAYAAYLPAGGTVTLDLSGASGPLAVAWFDPRSGTWTTAGSVAGGGNRSFTAPGSGDWALRLLASGAPPPAALLRDGFETGDTRAWTMP